MSRIEDRSRRSSSLSVRVIGASLLVGVAAGCASNDAQQHTDADLINTGLERLTATETDRAFDAERERIRRILEENASMIPALERGDLAVHRPVDGEARPPRTNLFETIEADDDIDAEPVAPDPRPRPEPRRDTAPLDTRETLSPELKREKLVAELAALLRTQADREEQPLRTYALLAALESMQPGAMPDPTAVIGLTPRERDLLISWRELFRTADSHLTSAGGDYGALALAVGDLADRMAEWQTLRISRSELCARVEGFGRFTPMPRRLLAGREHRVIVYVELEHFGHRTATGPNNEPGHKVQLSQQLSLFHEADGLLAWRQSEQDLDDFSRNRRRDFFIVQMIELPRTLTVGSYRLKVTIRDRTSGALAEAIIPIDIVADAALVREGR